MKRVLLPLFFAGLACQLSSCLNTEKEIGSTNADPRATYTPPNSADRTRMTSKTVLNTVQATHAFSDPNSQDHFVLQLRGTRILNAQAHLIVTSKAGDTLRHEVMPARALLDSKVMADNPATTVRDQEIAILRGMNSFFAADRFTQPAVPGTATPPGETDMATWRALQEDPSAVAFDFTGAGGAERRLAYSHKLGKAVVLNQ